MALNGIKFGFKVKIVQLYEKLFDKDFFIKLDQNDKEATDYWNSFFLLKVKIALN